MDPFAGFDNKQKILIIIKNITKFKKCTVLVLTFTCSTAYSCTCMHTCTKFSRSATLLTKFIKHYASKNTTIVRF